MINFIIVEDNMYFLQRFRDIVMEFMFNNKFSFDIKTFKDYNSDFFDIVNEPITNKIYLLDIHTKNYNGIDIASKIRENDLDSTIIFLSAYEDDYYKDILRRSLQYFCFISKCEDFEKTLKLKLKVLLKNLNKSNLVQFEENNVFYTIPENKILYIEKEKDSRKSKIVTDSKIIYCCRTLISFENDLKNFIRTHRNCLINPLRTEYYDFKKKKIYFDNDLCVSLLSRKYKNDISNKIEKIKKPI